MTGLPWSMFAPDVPSVKPKAAEDPAQVQKLLEGFARALEDIQQIAQMSFQDLDRKHGEPSFRRLYLPAEQSTSSTSYVSLGDQVANVGIPDGGYISVAYSALWKESAANKMHAAIFLNSDQLRLPISGSGTLGVQEARGQSGGILADYYDYLLTTDYGLVGIDSNTGVAKTDSTTLPVAQGVAVNLLADALNMNVGGTPLLLSGLQANGGPCLIRAPAGRYTVSIMFKATSGSVTVKERRLAVWTEGVSSGPNV